MIAFNISVQYHLTSPRFSENHHEWQKSIQCSVFAPHPSSIKSNEREKNGKTFSIFWLFMECKVAHRNGSVQFGCQFERGWSGWIDRLFSVLNCEASSGIPCRVKNTTHYKQTSLTLLSIRLRSQTWTAPYPVVRSFNSGYITIPMEKHFDNLFR